MSQGAREETDRAICALIAKTDHEAAIELAIEAYGPEILSFLKARLRDIEDAREALAWTFEDLWRGLPSFHGHSTFRTWAYAVARNAARRYVARELKDRGKEVPLSEVSRASALIVPLPPSTPDDDRMERLRALLDDDERTLLTLRIDREMDWNEVAVVMLYDGENPDPQDVAREAARLRKRFQLLKEKVRKLTGKGASSPSRRDS